MISIWLVRPKLLDLKFGGGLGIQTTRDANISLIEKLMLDLLQGNNKIWVNILSHKYASVSCILSHIVTIYYPSIWNSTIKAKNVLKDDLSWCEGSRNFLFAFFLSSSLVARIYLRWISGVSGVRTPAPAYNNALSLSTELCSRGLLFL